MRFGLAGFTATFAVAVAPAVHADPGPTADASALEDLERSHSETIHTRRVLADAVLVSGLVSIAGGTALMVPTADDKAWRAAGVNTAIFGIINTAVGLLALRGIGAEEDAWESDASRTSRRSEGGMTKARIHAALDERRESVGHAINLGLDCGYLGIGATAIVASRAIGSIDHPDRWLASGVAIAVQSAFLIGVDLVGIMRSREYHRAFVEGLAPSVTIGRSALGGDETSVGLSGAF